MFPRLPNESIEAALEALRRMGEHERRASEGASDESLDELEQKLGMPLPASYRAFLRRYNWIDLRLAKVLGVCPEQPYLDVAAQLEVVRRFVERTVAIVPEAHDQAEVLRRVVPAAAMGGNTIPHGWAIAFDREGNFYTTAHKEFSSCERAAPLCPQPESFEALLVALIRETYDDGYDDEDESDDGDGR